MIHVVRPSKYVTNIARLEGMRIHELHPGRRRESKITTSVDASRRTEFDRKAMPMKYPPKILLDLLFLERTPNDY